MREYLHEGDLISVIQFFFIWVVCLSLGSLNVLKTFVFYF